MFSPVQFLRHSSYTLSESRSCFASCPIFLTLRNKGNQIPFHLQCCCCLECSFCVIKMETRYGNTRYSRSIISHAFRHPVRLQFSCNRTDSSDFHKTYSADSQPHIVQHHHFSVLSHLPPKRNSSIVECIQKTSPLRLAECIEIALSLHVPYTFAVSVICSLDLSTC